MHAKIRVIQLYRVVARVRRDGRQKKNGRRARDRAMSVICFTRSFSSSGMLRDVCPGNVVLSFVGATAAARLLLVRGVAHSIGSGRIRRRGSTEGIAIGR